MCDGFKANETILDEWDAGFDKYRLVNLGSGPDCLLVQREDGSFAEEKRHFVHGALTSRIRELLKSEEINLLETADAAVWAKEFVRIKRETGWTIDDIDESLMIAWFANAMCAQMDSTNREGGAR